MHYHNLVVMYSEAPGTVSRGAVTTNMRRSLLLSKCSHKVTDCNQVAYFSSFDKSIDFGYTCRKISGNLQFKSGPPYAPAKFTNRPSDVVKPSAVLLVKIKQQKVKHTGIFGKLVKLNTSASHHDWGFRSNTPVFSATIHTPGFGFEKAPADGGFNEVATRNCVLELAVELAKQQTQQSNVNSSPTGVHPAYTTFLDADEFVLVDKCAASKVLETGADIVAYKTQQVIPITCLRNYTKAIINDIHKLARQKKLNCSADRVDDLIASRNKPPSLLQLDNKLVSFSQEETLISLTKLEIIGRLQSLLFRQFNSAPTLVDSDEYLLVPDITGHHPRTISNELLKTGAVSYKHNPKASRLPNTTKHCILSVSGAVPVVFDSTLNGFCGLHGHHPDDTNNHSCTPESRLEWINRRLFSTSVRKLLNDTPSLESLVSFSSDSMRLLKENNIGYLSIYR